MAHSKIIVQGIKLYANHGCMEEEGVIGGNYNVDVTIEADLSKPAQSDNLEETIDYVTVHEIVKKQMTIRSRLIEHAAKRILDSLTKKFPSAVNIEVRLTKLNPPIPGEVESVSYIISSK